MKKMVKNSYFLYNFVHFCYICAFVFFSFYLQKPHHGFHAIEYEDKGNSVSGNFRGIFPVQ